MSDAFVDVDLHDMTTDEARIEIKRALKTVSKIYLSDKTYTWI